MSKTADLSARRLLPLRALRKMAGLVLRRPADQPAAVVKLADRGYMICGTPRTGSTYFDQLLTSTAVLGKPREYFNYGSRRRQAPDYPEHPRDQIRIILTEGATENGVYGVKVFTRHLDMVAGRIDPFRDLPGLELVRLRRRDLLGQAISLARAHQTGQFTAGARAKETPVYDKLHIATCLERIVTQEEAWDGIFARLDAAPLELDYEGIAADPQGAVDRVAQMMRLPAPAPVREHRVHYRVQRDALNDEWRARFLRDSGDRYAHLGLMATPPSPPESASAS